MLMSITSMLLNIMVIMAIREDDRMSEDKFNISLVNLCSSNLVSCVFVKSISIVHNSQHQHLLCPILWSLHGVLESYLGNITMDYCSNILDSAFK